MTKQLKSAILKKARFLAAPEMKTIEIGVVGKFVTVKVLNSYKEGLIVSVVQSLGSAVLTIKDMGQPE